MKEAKLPSDAVALATTIEGRVHGQLYPGKTAAAQGGVRYQWPGTYFVAAFRGNTVYLDVGEGRQDLRLTVDKVNLRPMIAAGSGVYRVTGLGRGAHVVRLSVISENQAGPDTFLGFYTQSSGRTQPAGERTRQMEFIGDSYTVGYGNTSPTSKCTPEQVWASTDDSVAFGPLTAAAYGAEYQVNAISGRGVVRNYNGGLKETLVEMYPYVLFNKEQRYDDARWRPRVIVVGLGTNDFSTKLHAGERWASREDLHADYEAVYAQFLQQLRARNPQAYLLVWATDGEHGEVQAEAAKVVERLKAAGEDRIRLVSIAGLAMSGCDEHPSVSDDRAIAGRLREVIDSLPDVWGDGVGGTASAAR